jgi:hypothetical protein
MPWSSAVALAVRQITRSMASHAVPLANSRTDGLMAAARGARSALPGALTAGFQDTFLVGAGFAIVGAILAFVLIRRTDSRAHVGADPASVSVA